MKVNDHLAYRPDIDGLRALAVLSVVLFHAFPTVFKSGFIGVDIFFVISGYLITKIIHRDIVNNEFSFLNFYARRFRRIAPALVLVLIVIWLIGWKVLLAEEYASLGKHLVGGSTFISNILLWRESGYFDKATELKPLLHLWSLGIEEQFYMIWPLILVFVLKKKISPLMIVISMIVISFSLNVLRVVGHSSEVFYLPHTRLWELLLGSYLAFKDNPRHLRFLTSNQKSLISMILLALGLLLIDKEKFFPGWWALLPTLGAYFFLASGPDALYKKKVFSNPVSIFVGRISYPLYLWHWPLLSLAQIVEEDTPILPIRVIVVLISFLAAWLTWVLLEKPVQVHLFQKFSVIRRNFYFVCFSLLIFIGLGVIGYGTYFKNGLKGRHAAIEARNAATEFNFLTAETCLGDHKLIGSDVYCIRSPKSEKQPEIIILGDSHASHLVPGLITQIPLVQLGKANCPALYQVERSIRKKNLGCLDIYNQIHHILFENYRHAKVVILSSQIPWEFMNLEKPELWRFYSVKNKNTNSRNAMKEGFSNTIKYLHALGKTVFFFIDIPELKFPPRSCVNLRPFHLNFHARKNCFTELSFVKVRQDEYRKMVNELKMENPSIQIFDPLTNLCNENECHAMKEGKILYRDDNHLNNEGSKFIASQLLKKIKPFLSNNQML